MSAIRYRTGIDARTGQLLSGWAHVAQSLKLIWTTRTGVLPMLLGFGSDHRRWLAEDLTTETALGIYGDLIAAAHAWEPEYRIKEMQLVRVAREGVLGLRHGGLYYPEGRYGNYDLAIPTSDTVRGTASRIARAA